MVRAVRRFFWILLVSPFRFDGLGFGNESCGKAMLAEPLNHSPSAHAIHAQSVLANGDDFAWRNLSQMVLEFLQQGFHAILK
jgi:hypothetical protein